MSWHKFVIPSQGGRDRQTLRQTFVFHTRVHTQILGDVILILRSCQSEVKQRSSDPAHLDVTTQMIWCKSPFLKMEMWISGLQGHVWVGSLPALVFQLVWDSLLMEDWVTSQECWRLSTLLAGLATRVAFEPCESLPSPVQKRYGVLAFWVYAHVLCGLSGYFGPSYITLTSSLEFYCSAWRILNFSTGDLFWLQIRQNLSGRQGKNSLYVLVSTSLSQVLWFYLWVHTCF